MNDGLHNKLIDKRNKDKVGIFNVKLFEFEFTLSRKRAGEHELVRES